MSGKGPILKREEALADLGMQLRMLMAGFRTVLADAGDTFDPPLTASEFNLLQWLSVHGPAKASAIADGLLMDRSIVSRLIKRLTILELLHSNPSDDDRRSSMVQLTEVGKHHLSIAEAHKTDRFVERTASLTDAEIQQLAVLLRSLNSSER